LITPPNEPWQVHLASLGLGQRFRVGEEVYRVHEVYKGWWPTVSDPRGDLVAYHEVFSRNGGSYFVTPVASDKGVAP
jgi:hypothetical protein